MEHPNYQKHGPTFICNSQDILLSMIENMSKIDEIIKFLNSFENELFDLFFYILNDLNDIEVQKEHNMQFKNTRFDYSLWNKRNDKNPFIYAIRYGRADLIRLFITKYMFPTCSPMQISRNIKCDEYSTKTEIENSCKIIGLLWSINPDLYLGEMETHIIYRALKYQCKPIIEALYEEDDYIFEHFIREHYVTFSRDVQYPFWDRYHEIFRMIYRVLPNYAFLNFARIQLIEWRDCRLLIVTFLIDNHLFNTQFIIDVVKSLSLSEYYSSQIIYEHNMCSLIHILKEVARFSQWYKNLNFDANELVNNIDLLFILDKIKDRELYTDMLDALYKLHANIDCTNFIQILEMMNELDPKGLSFKTIINIGILDKFELNGMNIEMKRSASNDDENYMKEYTESENPFPCDFKRAKFD